MFRTTGSAVGCLLRALLTDSALLIGRDGTAAKHFRRMSSQRSVVREEPPIVYITPRNQPGGNSDASKQATPQIRKIYRRKRSLTAFYRSPRDEAEQKNEMFADAIAYADSFDLSAIMDDARMNLKYQITLVDDVVNVAIHLTPRRPPSILSTTTKPATVPTNADQSPANDLRELFIFSDGVIVYWNVESVEKHQIASYLQRYQTNPYSVQLSHDEAERMPFQFTDKFKSTIKKDVIYLQKGSDEVEGDTSAAGSVGGDGGVSRASEVLERYSFSHALASSVKIGVWENQLSEQAEPLSEIAKGLTDGKILLKRNDTLKKIGEFARLRHSINMTELLEQDIYWERAELERLYDTLCNYLTVRYRLNTMNKRLDYCQQLVTVIDNTLTHRHASALEWLIIALIGVEIVFDMWHFFSGSSSRSYAAVQKDCDQE